MSTVRIALANLPYPASPAESVARAAAAIELAGAGGVDVICFPECYVPGYRSAARSMPAPDAAFLQDAWTAVAQAAGRAKVTTILGTERLDGSRLLITAAVIDAGGNHVGWQDKVQIDPSEENTYSSGVDRTVFTCAPFAFGISICHEGWRYPETVRWAARRGAQVIFHPHFHEAERGSYRPREFADPANSFHEKAALCRAAENTCFFATVNYASEGSPTTSAVVRPDGTLLCHQPYGKAGLLIADLDLSEATGLLAARCRY